MTDKELKCLSRSELLEMLIAQMEENKRLKIRLKKEKEKVNNRQIAIDRAGSIAEAALALNGVFDAAQAAASQYLENIRQLSDQQEAVCQQIEADVRAKAEAVCSEADAYSQKVRAEADLYQKRVKEKIAEQLREKREEGSSLRSGREGSLL